MLKQFASLLDRPQLIAFGAANAFHGLRGTIDLPFCYVLDDTPGYAGQSVDALPIKLTAALAQMTREKLCVIICANTTNAISRMSETLRLFGLVYGEHFIDCSLLHEITISGHLKAHLNIFTSDETFSLIHALSRSLAVPNLSTISGTWLFTELVESLPTLADGYAAECGVYQGGNALVSLLSSPQLRSGCYQLFDSFEGLGELSENDPKLREGEFTDANFDSLRETLAIFARVQLTKGYFE